MALKNTAVPDQPRTWWRQPLRRLAGLVLIVASGAYVWAILDASFDQLTEAGRSLRPAEWTFLLIGTLGTLILSTLYHVLAARRIEPGSTPASKLALAYALGQIMRYIPGKIVGVLFQARYLAGQMRASTIALALIVQTVYDYAWTFAFAGSILLCSVFATWWPLLFLLPAGLTLWQSHVHGWCERVLLFAGPVRRLFGQQDLYRLEPPRYSGSATLVLLGEWIPMLLGIALGLNAVLGWSQALLFGAIYLVAAVASLLVFVVPSGLVVREALFVWLGLRFGFEAPMLLFLGLVLRAALTLGEVLNVFFFAAADALLRKLSSALPTGTE